MGSVRLAIIDLDGVVFKSPSGDTIADHGFWFNYWNRPLDHEINKEIHLLAHALVMGGVYVVFLTARPMSVLNQTLSALRSHMFLEPHVHEDIDQIEIPPTDNPYNRYHLVMCDIDHGADGWVSSGKWKFDVVENLKMSYDVLFAVEDYKPNAEEIRKATPVLLYEQRRSGGD